MKIWTVLCSLYILTVTNCRGGNDLGQSCTTQSGAPGTFQSRLRCPSIQSNAKRNKNAEIICCPHQTFTRSINVRRTSTRKTKPKRKNRATTPAPSPYLSVCGRGGASIFKRKTRSIYDEEASAEYYESGENITDAEMDEYNMTTAMVVGGSEASPHSWPWMAGLAERTYFSSRSKIFCGGTLVSSFHVLSAAHCVKSGRRIRNDFAIRLGGHSLNDGTTHSVRSTVVHPNYRNYYNDISVITLRERVVFTTNVQPICLPSPEIASSSLEGLAVMAIGWGTTSSGGPQSRVLRQAQVNVVSNKKCDASYAKFYRRTTIIISSQICANSPGRDTCQGDSGGPLLLLGRDKKWYQVGVTSFGQGCAVLYYPGVYTRVGAFRDWIRSKTGA